MAERGKKKDKSLPLKGVRVVSLEHAVGAPLGSRLLGDLGADVIKVERAGRGDFGRYWDTSVNGLSSYFVWLNRNKRSITLDLRTEEGKRIFNRFLEKSDVFIQNLSPGSIERLGFDHASICKRHPGLIYCSLSGYGQGGPYKNEKAYDLLIQGESGLINLTGYEDKPAKVGVSIADISSGLYSTIAILSALLKRKETGKGCFIDISMFDCMLDVVSGPLLYFLYSGNTLKREGMRHNVIVPYGPFLASDKKYISCAVENEEEWKTFCLRIMNQPELLKDPRFSSNEMRLRNRAILEPIIESVFLTKTSEEWSRLLHKADIASGKVNDLDAVSKHPQLAHRKLLKMLRTERGVVRAIANPIKIDNVTLPMKRVPYLGQDTKSVLKDFGLSVTETDGSR